MDASVSRAERAKAFSRSGSEIEGSASSHQVSVSACVLFDSFCSARLLMSLHFNIRSSLMICECARGSDERGVNRDMLLLHLL